jgi:ketosteroid isomerase-like protein
VTSEAHRPTRASANDPPQANPGGLVQLVFLVVWRKESEGEWRIAREFLSAEASTDQS